MSVAGFVYLWEYVVKDEAVATFRRIYGPEGDWARLFSRSDDYLRTELYQDVDEPTRFITCDFWISRAARDAFRLQFREDFDRLDHRCEELTVEERCLGDFNASTR